MNERRGRRRGIRGRMGRRRGMKMHVVHVVLENDTHSQPKRQAFPAGN